MTKAYSNRALPAGTILREWRLEEVLGVGGFGIVYKGRGIYFNELVAIKEYFPGSISERDAEETVVPIDSDAEEVHALGLKKFVEEAKLLWNLSTPTRHPNIVNVRSLFEIHGTAYMVMDFEDGMSLGKMLKQKTRFNERSLLGIVRPIAEGLERAHRVGVLHRDIKPPNILINPDGRPVLIDFGSARFEAADATSTTITFHTPPYAAIEQYVKTYPQGPWTDVYALGVVLYECVAGEKPAEVLDRLHGGQDKPLADSHWPGFSPRFLAAVDEAMRILPKDRPQSITEWLALLDDKPETADAVTIEIEDEEATRFATFNPSIEEIKPVTPPESELVRDKIETRVPSDPSDAEFKRAGEDSRASIKKSVVAPAAEAAAAALASADRKLVEQQVARDIPAPIEPVAPVPTATPGDVTPTKKRADSDAPKGKAVGAKRSPLLVGVGIAGLVTAGVAGWLVVGGRSTTQAPAASAIADVPNATSADLGDGLTPVNVMTAAPTTNAIAPTATVAAAPVAVINAEPPKPKKQPKPVAAIVTVAPTSDFAAADPVLNTASSSSSSSKIGQLNGVIDDGRRMARDVIRMGRGASGQLQANAQLATGYDKYLATLKDSGRGVTSDRQADQLITRAKQTRAYLVFLVKNSSQAK